MVRVLAGRGAREDVEELTADVFLALWAHAGELNPEQGLRPWLGAVARNRAADWLRTHKEAAPLPEDAAAPGGADPQAEAERREWAARLWDAVEGLDEPDRTLFLRYYYYGDKLKDIARALGLTQTAAKQRLFGPAGYIDERRSGGVRDRMQELWDGAVPVGVPCPQADPAAVKRRVNAALNAVPSERRAYMRHKIRFAAAAAAIAALLAGSALAVASRWNVLDFYFEGDNTPVEDYVSHETYSIRDDNYTLSVISSVADTSSAYLLVTIDAKNDAAAAALMADDFENIDTFSVRVLADEAAKPEPTPTGNGPAVEMPVAGGFSYGEKEALRTETSRTYSMRVDELNAAVYAVQLRLGLMEEGSYVEIPVELVEPVTVEVNAEGTGSGTFDHIEGGAPVTLETVSLSPLSIQMEYSFADADGDAFPLLFFRMTDGSLCGWGQIVGDNLLGPTSWNDRGTIHCDYAHPLRSVLELSQVDAVVFNGMAYPLDGGRPEPVEIDPALYPFQIPLMDRLSEGGGYSVPVRALCEGLGVDCVWSNEAQTAAMTYRGVTIILTPGSTTALVDGQPVEMLEAPAVQDGKLAACYAVFEDAWQVSMSAAYDNWPSDNAQRVAWLVIP